MEERCLLGCAWEVVKHPAMRHTVALGQPRKHHLSIQRIWYLIREQRVTKLRMFFGNDRDEPTLDGSDLYAASASVYLVLPLTCWSTTDGPETGKKENDWSKWVCTTCCTNEHTVDQIVLLRNDSGLCGPAAACETQVSMQCTAVASRRVYQSCQAAPREG